MKSNRISYRESPNDMKRQPKQTKTDMKPGVNPHDRFARKVIGDPLIAADLLRHYTEPVIGEHVDLDSLKPEPTQNFGKEFKELVKDIAFVSHLVDKKGKSEVLIIAEHKSKPEPFVILQLLVYLVFTWYKRWTDAGRPQSTKNFRLPMPVLVVLYNGKDDWKGELNIRDLVASVPPELEQFIPEVKVLLIRLNRFDVDHLPGKPETQAVVESMIRATDGTFVAGLESILGRFTDLSLDDRINELIQDIIYYCDLVEVVTPDELDKAIINTIKGEKGIKMVQTIKKGISQIAWEGGVAAGEVKGRVEGKVETLLKILRTRFCRIPKDVEKTILSMTDPVALDSYAVHAATCQSMAEFSQAVR